MPQGPEHQAAFLDGPQKLLRVGPIHTEKPGPGEVLVAVTAMAVNPVDWKIQDVGMFINEWPAILGEDVAGEIVEVGEGVTNVSKGQRVIGHALFFRFRELKYSGFQEFVIFPQTSVAALPDSVSYEAGAVLPLSVSTAGAGLFQPNQLALEKPSTNPEKNGKTLLVWGGSSSVGTSTIQLAVAAGYDVITTASKKNFDLVKNLGATAVFDYSSPGVVAELVAELKKGAFAGAYDAIGLRESQHIIAQVVTELGGGHIATVLPYPDDLPPMVTSSTFAAPTIFSEYPEVGKAVWEDFLPQALKTGQFKPSPPEKVVGKGLDSLQSAFDQQKAGVSAAKIVVTL
ncbi:hypothetical protein DL770_010242 [Monosporascus sp. CRB-9-2]|nr:hypothetical protein DL770_010242 [Monosporascus sp. CRB-9-2]